MNVALRQYVVFKTSIRSTLKRSKVDQFQSLSAHARVVEQLHLSNALKMKGIHGKNARAGENVCCGTRTRLKT